MSKKIVQWVKSAIHQDYFAIVFNYNVKLFQCRYKMTRHLFLCNMEVMLHLEFVFTIEHDSCDLMNFLQIQKCASVVKMFAYKLLLTLVMNIVGLERAIGYGVTKHICWCNASYV